MVRVIDRRRVRRCTNRECPGGVGIQPIKNFYTITTKKIDCNVLYLGNQCKRCMIAQSTKYRTGEIKAKKKYQRDVEGNEMERIKLVAELERLWKIGDTREMNTMVTVKGRGGIWRNIIL